MLNNKCPPIFHMRSVREDPQADYRIVSRQSYKAAVESNDRRGLPYRVETSYFRGRPQKWLTLLPLEAHHQVVTETRRRAA